MSKKYFIPLYAEHIHFLIKRCGWFIRKIYAHYNLEQSKFKKEFVIMNQISRQNSQTTVVKDFYKVMNNLNFGYGCRNKIENCFFAPIYSEVKEISYIKKYQSLFGNKISDFVSCKLMKQETECEFNNSMMRLNVNYTFYEVKKKKKFIED